jgi:oligopeptide/dipeptide ABC transporter ATP-binding protein
MSSAPAALLELRDLSVVFKTDSGPVQALDRVTLSVPAGRTVAVVGESGSGKTVTALTVMGLHLHAGARISSGVVCFDGEEVLPARPERLRELRGSAMAMIFQEPMTSLNPVLTIGEQVAEPLRLHAGMSRAAARVRAVEVLDRVQLPDPRGMLGRYPHELSGGQRQRVMIAMALIGGPRLLLADEPTTALDVTVQAQVLQLLRRLQREDGMAMVLITHDFGVVAEVADEVAVMYAGRVVETGPVGEVIRAPLHPYTEGLLRATRLPAGRTPEGRLEEITGVVPLLRGSDPGCSFRDRCALAQASCAQSRPLLASARGSQQVACFVRSPR